MAGVVKAMDSALKSMNLEKVNSKNNIKFCLTVCLNFF